ncbi:MAG: nucleotidyltransferase domain-containing protein [Thermoplasmata archaeon]
MRIPSYGTGLGIDEVIGSQRTKVLRIARESGAENVRVFGSVARKQASPESDLGLVVVPTPGRKYRPIDLSLRLRRLLGRRVDVVSERSLHRLIQPRAVVEAVPRWRKDPRRTKCSSPSPWNTSGAR